MGQYFAYDAPSTLIGTDIIVVKQTDGTKSATIQNLINDVIQPLVDAATISNIDDIGDVTISGVSDGHVLTYQGGTWINQATGASFNPIVPTDNIVVGTGTTAQSITTGANNTILGQDAGETLTTSNNNVFIGFEAGKTHDRAGNANNVMIGINAGSLNLLGQSNVFLGNLAGYGNGIVGTGDASYNVAIGITSGYELDQGDNNTLVGPWAGSAITNGSNNICIGSDSAAALTTGGTNIYIGDYVGRYKVAGDLNIAIGSGAMDGFVTSDGTWSDNIAIGTNSGKSWGDDSYSNIAIGQGAGGFQVIDEVGGFGPTSNISIGYIAGQSMDALDGGARENISIGSEAGRYLDTGEQCISIGWLAGQNQENATDNVIIGSWAGQYSHDSYDNVYLGSYAGQNNDYGDYNVCIGYQAGRGVYASPDTTTYYGTSVYIGFNAGRNVTTGDRNVVIGEYAGYGVADMGDTEIYIGALAGQDSEGGFNNVYLGEQCGYRINSGTRNIVMGAFSGYSDEVVTGISQNIFMGYTAAQNIGANCTNNVVLGTGAAWRINSGTENVAIGTNAGSGTVSSGYNNCILIGESAGSALTTASNVICIGQGAAPSAADATNQMILGGTTNPVNVGINNNNPAYRLDVGGGINVTDNFYVNGTPFSSGVPRTVFNFVANPATQTFSFAPTEVTDIDNVDVWVNGIKLVRTTEYTLDGGGPTYTSLTISSPTIILDDDVEIITWE